MENQFPDWMRGAVFSPFPRGLIIFLNRCSSIPEKNTLYSLYSPTWDTCKREIPWALLLTGEAWVKSHRLWSPESLTVSYSRGTLRQACSEFPKKNFQQQKGNNSQNQNEVNGGRVQQFSLLIPNNKRSGKPSGCWCSGISVCSETARDLFNLSPGGNRCFTRPQLPEEEGRINWRMPTRLRSSITLWPSRSTELFIIFFF